MNAPPALGMMKRSGRSRPTGPGSRGGRYHEPEWRNGYKSAWVAAHPEYREREQLSHARSRARKRGEDPDLVIVPPTFPRALPEPAAFCGHACGCREAVVMVCGFCREGLCEPEEGVR
jgi:hypothetical protein